MSATDAICAEAVARRAAAQAGALLGPPIAAWLLRLLEGDLGRSIQSQIPVLKLIGGAAAACR